MSLGRLGSCLCAGTTQVWSRLLGVASAVSPALAHALVGLASTLVSFGYTQLLRSSLPEALTKLLRDSLGLEASATCRSSAEQAAHFYELLAQQQPQPRSQLRSPPRHHEYPCARPVNEVNEQEPCARPDQQETACTAE